MCDIENIDNNKNDDFNLRDIQNDNCSEEHIYNYNGSIKDEIINIHENCHSYVNVLYFKKLKLNKRIFGKLKDKNIVIYLKYKDSKCTSKNIQVTDPEITNLYLCFLITEPFIKDEKNIIKIYIKYLKDDKYKILSFGFLELNLIDFSEKFYKKKSYMLCYDKNNNKYIFGYFILILANQIKWTVYNNNVSYQITKNSYFINNQINYDEQLLYICKKIEQILLKSVFTNKSNSIQNTQNKDLLKHFTVTHSCPATFRITPKEKTTLNGNAPPKEKETLNGHSMPTQIVDKKDVDQKDVKQISYQSAGIDNADEKCESTNIKTNDSNFGNHIKQIGQDENVDENVEGSIDEIIDEHVDENLDENDGENVERRMDENVEGRMDEIIDEHVDENSSLNEATYSKKFILNKNIKKHKSLQNLNNHNPRLKIPSNYLNSKKTNLDDNSICNYHSDGAIKKAFSENFLSRIILDEDQNIEKLNLLKKNTTIKPKPKLNLKPLDNKINNFIIKSKNNISTNKTKFFLEKHHKMYCAQNNKIPIKQNNSPINITQKEETKEDYHISCIHNIFDGDGDGDKDGDGNGNGNGDGDEDLSNNINNVSTCLENKITDSITQSLNGSKNTTDVLTEVQKEIDESHMLHDKNESNDICNYNDPDVNNDKRDEIDSIYEDENLFDIFILKKLENILNNNLDNFIEQAEFILHHMKKKILKKNEFFAEQIKNQYSTNTVLIKKDIFDKKNENSECCILSKQDDHTEKNNINYNVKNDILKILENCIHTTLLYIQFVLSDKNVDTTQKDVFITYKEIINNIKNAIDDCKKQKETISLNYTNNINFDSLSKDRKNILLTTTKSENENVIEKINPYSYVNDDSCLTMSSCSDSSQTEEIMIFKPVNYINKNISTSIQYYQKKWKHKLSKVGMYV
ncbi:hypothetical protein YYC_02754 [Plasmodium yoelii 17X]|uniref:Uncharacterized protein n=1 Tax=Plasmodium yoelii 17X TaxID=1323249 RepID=V7PLK8_PLAYE|nr:hypothetical protein YYC_02754 [Plasmodium yoelii 17X]